MSGILSNIFDFAKSNRGQRLGAGLRGMGAGLLQAGAPRVGAPGPNPWAVGLGGFSGGVDAYDKKMQAEEMQALQRQMVEAKLAKQKREERQARARSAYANMQGVNTRPDGSGATRTDLLRGAYPEEFAKAEIEQMMPSRSGTPMSIKEWERFSAMTPEEQEQYLQMKRAQKVIDIGGAFAAVSPVDPTQVTQIAEKTLNPGEEPDVRLQQAAASAEGTAVGKEAGEAKARLSAAIATYPKLEGVVNTLKDLGKKASYSWASRAKDEIAIQMGGEASEGAIARGAYIATVKNNILPLLRQTFGAAFTAAESDSLLATLGDPNTHPSIKDAVLEAFIAQKYADIQAMQRQVGGNEDATDLKTKYGLE